MKLLIIFGTRPEAIKMAPLVKELKKQSEFETRVLVTAQHRQMLDQVLDIFEIEPDYDLDLMKPNQDITEITTRILQGCRDIFRSYHPDLILVHGDTTTAMASALAAFYQRIDVAHVEAGLRTFNIYSPYPEELNRQVISKIAKFHFAPTVASEKNLLDEQIDSKRILVSGNTVIDALLSCSSMLEDRGAPTGLKYVPSERPFVLITGHRRENFGESFVEICEAVKHLASKYESFDFVYPVHLNPNVQQPVMEILSNLNNIFLIEPLEYVSFVYLMRESYLILTDSGGVQEEAPSLGKPVLVMRETTERPEAVTAGTVKLVGSSSHRIISEVSNLIENKKDYESMQRAHNPYGDGKAAERIVNFLKVNLCAE